MNRVWFGSQTSNGQIMKQNKESVVRGGGGVDVVGGGCDSA